MAQGRIFVGKEAFDHIKNKTLPKGDPLVLAEIAGINGAKMAYQNIPLCHPLGLDQVAVYTILNEEDHSITVYCIASAVAKTGVEMEAIGGVNAALLTIYDLSKMINADLKISDIRLLFKAGGKSGLWFHAEGVPNELREALEQNQKPYTNMRAVAIEMSDRAYNKVPNYPDIGLLLKDELERLGANVLEYILLPDDKELIKQTILRCVNEKSPDLIVLHGGTGLSTHDVTPLAVMEVADRIIPGIGECMRKSGEKFTPYTWISSSLGAIIKQTLLIVIPGSKNSIYENLSLLSEIIVKGILELHETTTKQKA